MVMSLDANSSQPRLPEEVWSQVFSFLLAKDLKSVRLTCHVFYEACNTLTIHKNEEFYFPPQLDTETIKSLINTNRKVWNIKLNWVDLTTEPILPFFQKHGANIYSLTLAECRDSKPETLPVIIEHCEFLHNFIVYYSLIHTGDDSDGIFAGFETLQRNNIVRGRVESLTLIETYQQIAFEGDYFQALSNKFFLSIFTVFPNIKRLEITVNIERFSFDERRTTYPLHLRKMLTFSSLYHQLFKMRDQLKKLKLYFMYDLENETDLVECFHKIAQIEMKNLEELSLNWPNLLDISTANCFSRFNHLTEFKCFIGDTLPVTKSYFVQLLLETQKKLRYLHLTTTGCVSMDKECFIALMTSHLTTFIIYRIYNWDNCHSNSDIFHDCDECSINYIGPASVAANFEQSCLENSLISNYTLKDLKVHTSDKNLLLLFSTYFKCLDNLKNYEVKTLLTEIIGRYF